jgi:hypothetical protein
VGEKQWRDGCAQRASQSLSEDHSENSFWKLFGCAFEELKSEFNTQKVNLKKKNICLIKRIESTFKGSKMAKKHLLT